MRSFMKKSKILQKGFTLVELLIVSSIVIASGVLATQSLLKGQEIKDAQNVGKQALAIGTAINPYIANHYATIGSMTNSTGSATDPGPRTCTAATNSCVITIQTLINEGLLPNGFAVLAPYTGYNITLRRTGTAPAWNIDALAVTTNGWLNLGTANVKYDMVGVALKEIGPDGGMTFQSNTTVSGLHGAWTETNATYPSITAAGQLAVRAGNGASMFSQFLRRDGTLPMFGNLDMGGQDINNADDIRGNNISTANSGCKRTELNSVGQIYSRDAPCASRFTTDPNGIGQTTVRDAAGNAVALQNAGPTGTTTAGNTEMADRRVGFFNQQGSTWNEGGTMWMQGNDGQRMYTETTAVGANGSRQRWINNAWSSELMSVDQAGNLRVSGDIYLNGRPTPLNTLLPSYASRGAYAVSNGQTIAKPSCGATGGTPKIVVTPAVVTSQIHAGGGTFWSENGFIARATDNGWYWTVTIVGWPTSAAPAYGMAHVYCHFGAGT